MEGTKIRWATHTWNVFTGCTEVSPGCDACYARVIATKFKGTAFPNGFDPTYKPQKLRDAKRFLRKGGPGRVFVNSMSDMHHADFTVEQIDSVYDEMRATPEHDYLVLTKRPQLMASYFLGHVHAANTLARDPDGTGPSLLGEDGWLARRGLTEVPSNIWLGASIESDRYAFRADHLRRIPVAVRFISAEPLLTPLDRLDLDGIGWVIVGGESGRGYRPMDHDWARDLRDRCADADVAFYFKQSAAPRTEMGIELDGRVHEEYPFPHPAVGLGTSVPRTVGRYVDDVEHLVRPS